MKSKSHLTQKLLPRPFCEPINCTTIYQWRKHSTSGSKCFSNRTHTQHYVQVVSHTADQISIDSISKTRVNQSFQASPQPVIKLVIKILEQCVKCSKLTIKTPDRHHWRRSGVVIVNFENISHLVLVFLLLTLRR